MNTATEILSNANLEETHWGKRILTAELNSNKFTEKDRLDASGWTTCACGRAAHAVELSESALDDLYQELENDDDCDDFVDFDQETMNEIPPEDEELKQLGELFYSRVRLNDPRGAAETLVDIEGRAFLLAGRRSFK